MKWALSLVALAAVACDEPPQCAPGQVRFDGRPPRRLFAYDTSCRSDCFSAPDDAKCKPSCKAVQVDDPRGLLVGDRQLVLADNLDDKLALLFSFGFVDEAGGTAPSGWGFRAVGPAAYASDELRSTARFVLEAGVAEVTFDNGRLTVGNAKGESLRATPARLEIDAASDRLAGNFYLGFESEIGHRESEVVGCFDLAVGAAEGTGASEVRALAP